MARGGNRYNKGISKEFKEFVNRFGLSVADLKRSPDYEQEMLVEKGSTDLCKEDFNYMLSLFPKKDKERNPDKVYKDVLCVETGEVKTCAGWSYTYSNTRMFYLQFAKGIDEFKWRGFTWRKVGEWK
ncbi:MAG: hypothetical protein ACRCX2_20415 [Paraclostridium sp.]